MVHKPRIVLLDEHISWNPAKVSLKRQAYILMQSRVKKRSRKFFLKKDGTGTMASIWLALRVGIKVLLLLHLIPLFSRSTCESFSLRADAVVTSQPESLASTFRWRSDGSTAKPIVYTVAGSDSGGGAGIQADLHAIQNFQCHACSIITCLTAQNSFEVSAIHTPPVEFLIQQWEALISDLPPMAIKIGMLGSKDMVMAVGALLKDLRERTAKRGEKVWIVLDPVMITTSGARLIDRDAQQALIEFIFPLVDIITPNLFEAQVLIEDSDSNGRPFAIQSYEDMELAAAKLLKLGCNAVLMKGGHFSSENSAHGFGSSVASDYLLIGSKNDCPSDFATSNDRRLCDADETLDSNAGVWLQSPRYDTSHTHGTGCTLSSALASALAIGEDCRRRRADSKSSKYVCGGAYTSINLVDASCLAKAYVTAGISQSHSLMGAKGPGPVAQTTFPDSYQHFPTIQSNRPCSNTSIKPSFLKFQKSMNSNDNHPALCRVLPIVDSVQWVERLCEVKSRHLSPIEDIQFRIKGEHDSDSILSMIKEAQEYCAKAGIRLWVNDYWKEAVATGCFGVHLGQEDLYKCFKAGGIEILRQEKKSLGISTHSFGELAVALGLGPTYISLGPIFPTSSKNVQFDPQGLIVLRQWRKLVPPDIPLIAIGGISDVEMAANVRRAGAECIAVIGAVTESSNIDQIADSFVRLDGAML